MINPDFHALWNTLLPVAQQMLNTHGEFYPLAAAVTKSGQVTSIAADIGVARPKPAELIQFLTAALAAQAANGEIRGAAICYDVRIPAGKAQKMDAIQGHIELVSGEAVDVFVPYVKGSSGQVQYEDVFAAPTEKRIFKNPSTP